MAFSNVRVLSERWLDEVLIVAEKANVDGEQDDGFAAPDGVGDLAIMEWSCVFASIATLMANPETAGVSSYIVSPGSSSVVDAAGGARFLRDATATRLFAFVQPDALVLWRQGELFGFNSPEVDTNATPTADLFVRIKCVRVRPIESSAPAPIRLVR